MSFSASHIFDLDKLLLNILKKKAMASQLKEILADRPGDLLLPDEKLKESVLKELQQVLDPVAKSFSPLDGIHTDGLDIDQVWLQVLMVVDGAIGKIYNDIAEILPDQDSAKDSESEEASGSEDESQSAADSPQSLPDSPQADEGKNWPLDEEVSEQDGSHDSAREEEEDEEDEEEEDNATSPSETNSNMPEDMKALQSDGFDLGEYQQHVLALENSDNEDEDIDFFAENPGPDDDDDDGADLKYEDFFGARRPKKQQKRVSNDSDEDIDQADYAARQDLFASESEEEEENNPQEGLSKFERQQQELERQIRELESENVGEKEWGMRGEIQGTQRPGDSLIDAEVEFERNAKPAPVITREVTDSLEELIRSRVAKREFDDLPKRSTPLEPRQRPELPELSDRKAENSLAEQYEQDHLRSSNPEYFAKQDRDKLDVAHKEVVDLFSNVVRKLDALCSWHYTPKAPKPSLEIRTEAPAITMEEAQPGTLAANSTMAPQEIYRPEATSKEDIIGPNGLPVSRSEMSSEDLRRQRRREKQRKRKSDKPEAPASDKNQMFNQLQRGNVKVVDKKGRKRDLRGNVVKDNQSQQAASIKL